MIRLILAGSLLMVACSKPDNDNVPESPVVDTADILPPDREAALDRKLREYFDQSGTAIVVNSVRSLEGRTIEEVANQTFDQWGIGDKETNRGLLILVAKDDRKVRIEVGYGLNCTITGPVAGRIIRNEMIPLFKTGDMSGAIEAGVDGLIRDVAAGPVDDPLYPGCRQELDKAA